MEYKKFGSVYAVRIDKGEEILAKLKEFAEREKVAFARVSAIGSQNNTAPTSLKGISKLFPFRGR